MEIKILSSEEVEFKEKDVQHSFERDLSKLEDGLEFVSSEVVIGTGRIDTLAYDTNTGRPVFIEYKRRGEFGKDALIQLMDYLSWFARDENRMVVLEKLVRQYKPDIEDFEPSIRLICVATGIEERVKNAIYAIANHVKVFSYMVAKDTANNLILVPKLEVDNNDIEIQIRGTTSEGELLKSFPHLGETYQSLKSLLEKDGASSYSTGRSLRFKKERVFAIVHFRKQYIHLELRVGMGKVSDQEFRYWKKGNSKWGYFHVHPGSPLPEKVKEWIESARQFACDRGSLEAEENEDT
jgi:hypothetical protein